MYLEDPGSRVRVQVPEYGSIIPRCPQLKTINLYFISGGPRLKTIMILQFRGAHTLKASIYIEKGCPHLKTISSKYKKVQYFNFRDFPGYHLIWRVLLWLNGMIPGFSWNPGFFLKLSSCSHSFFGSGSTTCWYFRDTAEQEFYSYLHFEDAVVK